MAQKRVITIRLNSDGKAPALPAKKVPKSRSEMNLEDIKARASQAALKNGTSQAKELARLVENYLNQD